MNIKQSFPKNEDEDIDMEVDYEDDFQLQPAGGSGVNIRAWREDEFGNQQVIDIRLESGDIARINEFLK